MTALTRLPAAMGSLQMVVLLGACFSGDAVADPPHVEFAWDTVAVPPREYSNEQVMGLPTWSVLPVAGWTDGESVDEGLFKAVSAFYTDGSGVVVANTGFNQVLLLGRGGGEVVRVGAEGEGPGEFLALSAVFPWKGDSILAYDRATLRMSVLDGHGVYGRSFRLTAVLRGAPDLIDVSDEALLFRSFDSPSGYAMGRGGLTSRVAWLHLVSLDGADIISTLGAFPQGDEYVFGYRPNLTIYRRPVPFGRVFRVGSRGGTTAIAFTDSPKIGWIDEVGGLRTLTWIQVEATPLTRADLNARLDSILAAGVPSGVEALYTEMRRSDVLPEWRPVLGQVTVDEVGMTWVEWIRDSSEGRPVTWLVMDQAGEPAARVELDRPMELLWVGEGGIVARTVDQFDMEHLHLLKVIRDSDG